jgi:hypothetical protein
MKDKLLNLLIILTLLCVFFTLVDYYFIHCPDPFTYTKFKTTPDAQSDH